MRIGLLSGTLTFLFFRYFSSILYGCLAPVGKSNVITSVGPVESASLGIGVGWSDEGPIAGVMNWRVRSASAGGVLCEAFSPGEKIEGSGGGNIDGLRADEISAGLRCSVETSSPLCMEVMSLDPSRLDDLGRCSSLLISTDVDDIGVVCIG